MPSIVAQTLVPMGKNRGERFGASALVLITITFIVSGCREPDPPSTDPLAPRILSIGLAATQAALALELGDSIVASDPASRLFLDAAGFGQSIFETRAAFERPAREHPTLVLTTDQIRDDGARPVPDAFIPTIEVAPHDMDDMRALYRDLGFHAGVDARADRLARDLSKPLLERAARHLGSTRPCVAVVTLVAGFELAGGHSFETDVLHALGAESITHGGEAWRVATSPEALASMALDLVLVTGHVNGEAPQTAGLDRLRATTLVATAELDTDALWLGAGDGFERELDAWEAWIERARKRAPRLGSCALAPTSRPDSD